MNEKVRLFSVRGGEIDFSFSDGRRYKIGPDGSRPMDREIAELIVARLKGRAAILPEDEKEKKSETPAPQPAIPEATKPAEVPVVPELTETSSEAPAVETQPEVTEESASTEADKPAAPKSGKAKRS